MPPIDRRLARVLTMTVAMTLIVWRDASAQTAPAIPITEVTLPLQRPESEAEPAHGGHDHAHGDEFAHLPPSLGASLLEGWLDPWSHAHHSPRGTPYVHAFGFEPAFLGRELFVDFGFTHGNGAEYELEVEIEYAFTRRIGIVIEGGYAWMQPDGAPNENGFGDIGVVPRVLLLDYDRFLLAGNLGFEFPTGNDARGLGAGETVFAPSLSAWVDLGNRFTLQGNVGVEHGLSSGSDVLFWGGALAYSIYTRGEPVLVSADGAVRAHFPAGQINLIAEIGGEHPLDGAEQGEGTAAWLFGASYTITPNVEIRGGLSIPAWSPREFDNGGTVGIIIHF